MTTSRSRPLPKNRAFEDEFDMDSNASIEFSMSFPSQTRRSNSPGLKHKCCECGAREMRTQVERLKAENQMLLTETQILKEELWELKKQNLAFVDQKQTATLGLQFKNIECEELKLRIKEICTKIQGMQKPSLSTSMCSIKNQEDTLTSTFSLDRDRSNQDIDESCRGFQRKLAQEVSKYVNVKMKLELTLRKLEQKELLVKFLQNREPQQ